MKIPKIDLNLKELVPKILDRLRSEFKTILPQLIAIFIALLVGALVLLATGFSPIEAYGALIVGAFGDIHSIGKNIVKLMLEAGGFAVVDLGEDVSSVQFIEELTQNGGEMVALSTMMTTTLNSMGTIIDDVRDKFPQMRFLVGGASVTRETAQKFKASGFAENATEAVKVARKIAAPTDDR